MADQEPFSPFHDMFDGWFSVQNLDFIMDNNATIPTLEDLLSDHQLPSNSQSNIINPQMESDPLALDFLSDYNYEGGSTSQVGSLPIDEKVNNNNVEETQNLGFDSMIPFDCSCCQVLREIIHTNANNNFMKLEIHGKLGVFWHIILNSSTNHQFEKLDFCNKNAEEVKQFLVQYCLKRKQEGYVMVNEPLSKFYEALCVGLQWCDFQLCDAQFSDPPLVNSEMKNIEETYVNPISIQKVTCISKWDNMELAGEAFQMGQQELAGEALFQMGQQELAEEVLFQMGQQELAGETLSQMGQEQAGEALFQMGQQELAGEAPFQMGRQQELAREALFQVGQQELAGETLSQMEQPELAGKTLSQMGRQQEPAREALFQMGRQQELAGEALFQMGQQELAAQSQEDHQEPQAPQIDQQNQQPEAPNEALRDTKTQLALQRQRTKTITLMEISEHFHIPVIQAAEKMNLCETVLKHISRTNKVRRWPYRKLTSIKRKIIKLRPKLESGNEAIRERAQFEIAILRRDAIESCGGVDVLGEL